MNIEDFLEETADYWDPEEFKKADEDAQKLSADAWINKYGKKIMANKDLVADFYNLKNAKSLPERLRGSFGAMKFDPSDAWKQQIYQSEYKDVPRDEFEKQLAKMREYYNDEVARQDSIKERNLRKKELDDWGWRNIIASDYEKQRYLEDPKSAIFGKQAPGFIGSSAGAKADLAAGLAAGAADIATPFIPVPGINVMANAFAGPTIRAARDVAHKASDSPYQKDWGDIGMNFASDVGLNAATAGTANARKASMVVSNFVDPNVKTAFELSVTTDNIKKGLKNVGKVENSDAFIERVMSKNVPDSPLKQDLMSTINYTGTGVDVDKAREIVKAYGRDVDKEYQHAYKVLGPGGVNAAQPATSQGQLAQAVMQNPKPTNYLNQILIQPKLDKWGKAQYGMLRGMNAINIGNPGTAAFETLYNMRGRGTAPQVVDNQERLEAFERQKNFYKTQFGESWLKYPDFKPKEQEGDPAWEAYKEVMEGR